MSNFSTSLPTEILKDGFDKDAYAAKMEELRESRAAIDNVRDLIRSGEKSFASTVKDDVQDVESSVEREEIEEQPERDLKEENDFRLKEAARDMGIESEESSEENTTDHDSDDSFNGEIEAIDRDIMARASMLQRESDIKEAHNNALLKLQEENQRLKKEQEETKKELIKQRKKADSEWAAQLEAGAEDALMKGDLVSYNRIKNALDKVNLENMLLDREQMLVQPQVQPQTNMQGYPPQIQGQPPQMMFPNMAQHQVTLPGYTQPLQNYAYNPQATHQAPERSVQKPSTAGLPRKNTANSSGAVSGTGRIKTPNQSKEYKDIKLDSFTEKRLAARTIYKMSDGKKVPMNMEEKRRFYVETNGYSSK